VIYYEYSFLANVSPRAEWFDVGLPIPGSSKNTNWTKKSLQTRDWKLWFDGKLHKKQLTSPKAFRPRRFGWSPAASALKK
jgi:hypothetical protein